MLGKDSLYCMQRELNSIVKNHCLIAEEHKQLAFVIIKAFLCSHVYVNLLSLVDEHFSP